MRILFLLFTFLFVLVAAPNRVGPRAAYPPDAITGAVDPAVTQATIHSTICVANYTASVRAVTTAEKKAVLVRDHQTKPGCCEVDHAISLELGGSNDPKKNLWAEPYGGEYGAREKDKVETALHRRICGGMMTLYDAQKCITSDWIACGRKVGVLK